MSFRGLLHHRPVWEEGLQSFDQAKAEDERPSYVVSLGRLCQPLVGDRAPEGPCG